MVGANVGAGFGCSVGDDAVGDGVGNAVGVGAIGEGVVCPIC